jgi:hypothetical protein
MGCVVCGLGIGVVLCSIARKASPLEFPSAQNAGLSAQNTGPFVLIMCHVSRVNEGCCCDLKWNGLKFEKLKGF